MTDRMTEQEIDALCLKVERLATRSADLGDKWASEVMESALTAIRQLQQPWRGIDEDTPKDGTEIDVWVGGEFPRRITNVSWREPNDSEWWVHGGDTIETPDATWHDCFGPFGKDEQPTAWMPLPTPPETER